MFDTVTMVCGDYLFRALKQVWSSRPEVTITAVKGKVVVVLACEQCVCVCVCVFACVLVRLHVRVISFVLDITTLSTQSM